MKRSKRSNRSREGVGERPPPDETLETLAILVAGIHVGTNEAFNKVRSYLSQTQGNQDNSQQQYECCVI